jgi:plastocyanin
MNCGTFAQMAGALVLALVAGTARADVIKVDIQDLTFVPAQVSAHVGDTIKWTNDDFLAHTATSRGGEWNVMLPAHAAGSVTLKAEGTFEYYCRFHPNMTGRITVAK